MIRNIHESSLVPGVHWSVARRARSHVLWTKSSARSRAPVRLNAKRRNRGSSATV
jgi:hypothetical protein